MNSTPLPVLVQHLAQPPVKMDQSIPGGVVDDAIRPLIPHSNISELQEEQLNFLGILWAREVSDHSHTKTQLQNYLNLYMRYERAFCSENIYAKHQTAIIDGLRQALDGLKQEIDGLGELLRIAKEKSAAAELENSLLHDFEQEFVSMDPSLNLAGSHPEHLAAPPAESEVDYVPMEDTEIYDYIRPSDISTCRIEQLASWIDEKNDKDLENSRWQALQDFNPEKLALSDTEVETLNKEKKWQDRATSKRKRCSSNFENGTLCESKRHRA